MNEPNQRRKLLERPSEIYSRLTNFRGRMYSVESGTNAERDTSGASCELCIQPHKFLRGDRVKGSRWSGLSENRICTQEATYLSLNRATHDLISSSPFD